MRAILLIGLSIVSPASAQTKAGLVYDAATCVLHRIITPDDDKALGIVHVPGKEEAMTVVDVGSIQAFLTTLADGRQQVLSCKK